MAPTTTIIPRLPHLIPIASATNGTLYLVGLYCETSTTRSDPNPTTTYTGGPPVTKTLLTSTAATFSTTIIVTTSTVHKSTATVYEACQSDNFISSFYGEPLYFNILPDDSALLFVTYSGVGTVDSGVDLDDISDTRAGYQSREDCCNAIFGMYYHTGAGATGFSYYTDGTHLGGVCYGNFYSGPRTVSNPSEWAFLTGGEGQDQVYQMGNGPVGSPIWPGYYPRINPSNIQNKFDFSDFSS